MKAEGAHLSHTCDMHRPFNEITRSNEYYCPSGNVVILCESIAFKIHHSVVIAKSPLLKRVLADSNGQYPRPLYDGCPVIRLPERARNIKLLLKALYCVMFRTVFFNTVEGNLLLDVMAISYKYGFETMFKLSYKRLSEFYPTTLEEWNLVKGHRPDPALVILLSRDLNQPIFRPTAFYHLATSQVQPRTFNLLQGEDVGFYFSVQAELQKVWKDFIMQENDVRAFCLELNCHNGWTKFRQINRMKLAYLHEGIFVEPLSEMVYYSRDVVEFKGLCEYERRQAIRRAEFQRFLLWLRLPSLIYLSTWDILKQAQMNMNTAKFPPPVDVVVA